MSKSKKSDTSSSAVNKDSKTKDAPKTASSKSYSRGEAQKPVNIQYRNNWDHIFTKKNKKN